MRKRQEFKVSALEALEDRVVLRGGAAAAAAADNIAAARVAAMVNQAYNAFEINLTQNIINFADDLSGASNNGGAPVTTQDPNTGRFVFLNPVAPRQAFLNYALALQGDLNTLAQQLSSGLRSLQIRPANQAKLRAAIAAQVTGGPSDGVSFFNIPPQGSLARTLLSTGPLDAAAAIPQIQQVDSPDPNGPLAGDLLPSRAAQLQQLLGQASLNAAEQSRLALSIQAQTIVRVSRAIHRR